MELPKFERFSIQKSFTHEYQVLCSEMEEKFGKKIWSVPYMPFVTDEKLRRAWAIAQKRENYEFNYLVGILKKL